MDQSELAKNVGMLVLNAWALQAENSELKAKLAATASQVPVKKD